MNHNGSLPAALRLVEVAADAGADAVKFQLYDPHEQISSSAPTASYQRTATGEESMLGMAMSYDLAWDEHRSIAQHCQDAGIMYMSSCFDGAAVDFYRDIGGQVIKLASGEITHVDLLEHAADAQAPIILSTGMSTMSEIALAVDLIQARSDAPLALLHCVSRYPTPLAALNLNYMTTLAAAFGVSVGLSDHTDHVGVGGWAVAKGARIVEKHFTLDRTLPGPDHAMSCGPDELATYVANIRDAERALGSFRKVLTTEELQVRDAARRSVVAKRDIAAGRQLTDDDLAVKRPGTGLSPSLKAGLIGRRTRRAVRADQQITWEDL